MSNALGRAITARARIQRDKPAALAWFSLAGDAEVPFAVSQSHQYNIQIEVPPDAAPGSYSFRLDVVGVENPDELASQDLAGQRRGADCRVGGKGRAAVVVVDTGGVADRRRRRPRGAARRR